MKIKYLFPLIIIFVTFLVGCSAKTEGKSTSTPAATQKVEDKINLTATEKIANAIANNKSIKCEISKKDGKDSMTFEIKGKKSRASGSSLSGGKGTGYMLNDGEFMYIWNDIDKTGVKISLAMASPSGSTAPKQKYNDFTKEDIQKQYEEMGYKYDCNEAKIDDVDFVIPADVVFSDMSVMTKSIQDMQKNAQVDKTPTPEDLKKMMDDAKKYQGN